MASVDFNNTINSWIKALEQYPFADLCVQPAVHSWSLGQLYQHLINDTYYYIEQIKVCLSGNDNAFGEMRANAQTLFIQNAFPDEQIVGHPNNAFIPQPVSHKTLMQSLQNIKSEMNAIESIITKATFKGKTAHPGFGFLDAAQWFQLSDMHFRHHNNQKERIDKFLTGRQSNKHQP